MSCVERYGYKRVSAERQLHDALPTEVNNLFNVCKGRLCRPHDYVELNLRIRAER